MYMLMNYVTYRNERTAFWLSKKAVVLNVSEGFMIAATVDRHYTVNKAAVTVSYVTKYGDEPGRRVKTECSIWTSAGRSGNLKHFVTLRDVQPVGRNKEHPHNLATIIPLCL
jgi:hypothetical protein